MNRVDPSNNIQLLLSKLVTNPSFLIKSLENPAKFVKSINLTDSTAQQFIEFAEKYGQKFMISALVLRKKRLIDIKASLNLLNIFYNERQFDKFWDRYLSEIELDDVVPKNPLLESVKFCQYLLDKEKISTLEQSLITYDLVKTKVMIDYGLHPHAYNHLRYSNLDEKLLNSENTKIFFHPCMQIQPFNNNISEVVKYLLKNKSSKEIVNIIHQPSIEELLFFKNIHKGTILAVKLDNTLKSVIEALQQSEHSRHAFENMKRYLNINLKESINVVKNLVDSGLVMLIPNNSEVLCL